MLFLRKSNSVPSNRGRNSPRWHRHRAGTGHVELTPGEADVTRRGTTGELGLTGGIKEDGEATPPRRFPPGGAPWREFPRAWHPPHPSSSASRRPTGRPTAGTRRTRGLGRSPAPGFSVVGRSSSRLTRTPSAGPSRICNPAPGAHVDNTCSTAGDPSRPPGEGRAMHQPLGPPRYSMGAPRTSRAWPSPPFPMLSRGGWPRGLGVP